jgi:hypothetical protein
MFEPAPAAAFLDGNHDLIAMFDCLHDMGDPVGVGKHVKDRVLQTELGWSSSPSRMVACRTTSIRSLASTTVRRR